jgi:hypothetical protein
MHSLQFTAQSSSNGMVERDFTVGDVPGVLWSPVSGPDDYAPLVLMGHGGGNHKKHPAMAGRAQRLVTGCGFHVAVIDAPGHGDRPRTAHDEQEIAELFRARAVSRCSTPSPRRKRRCMPMRAGTRSCPGSRLTARSGFSPGTSVERSPRRPDMSGCGVRLASRAPLPRPRVEAAYPNDGSA